MPNRLMTKLKQGTAAPAPQPTTKSALDIAVDKVVSEIAANPDVRNCTSAEARTMITDWLTPIIERSRKNQNGRAYPYDTEMFSGNGVATRSYELFDAVMPHGKGSEKDSAHEAIEAVVLDPSRNEYGLIHEQTGKPRHCSVATLIGTVKGLPA